MSEQDLEDFRKEVRDWLAENCPEEMRTPMDSKDICWGGRNWKFSSDAQKIWLERMVEKGWTVPEWPKAYGGAGLSKAQAKILRKEMKRIKARPPLLSFGIWMLGPALLKYGSDEQRQEHLPKIARGEIRWAQGYSEPDAGSDLASLKTKCEDRGDHYAVTGQKVWTSYADQADWIFVLVRTDFSAKKHEGISFILVDMDQPGVTTRPIKLISGNSPFCETFFDEARAEKHNLIGEINKGWTIAKYLLTHEREMIGGMGGDVMRPIGDIAVQQIGKDEDGRLRDPVLRTDIARMEIDGIAFMATMDRVTQEAKAGGGVGANASMLKYYGTELNKRRLELMIDSAGSPGLVWGGEGDVASQWLRTKANSIEGGTSEVQLNIIAKRILDLPS
jgi:acyl-CoA dehydrogenase